MSIQFKSIFKITSVLLSVFLGVVVFLFELMDSQPEDDFEGWNTGGSNQGDKDIDIRYFPEPTNIHNPDNDDNL